jgi:hypothetical protein
MHSPAWRSAVPSSKRSSAAFRPRAFVRAEQRRPFDGANPAQNGSPSGSSLRIEERCGRGVVEVWGLLREGMIVVQGLSSLLR